MNFSKDTTKRFLKLISIFLLFRYSYILQNIPVVLFNIKNITPQIQILLSCFSNLILLLILFFIYRLDLRIEWKKFKNSFDKSMDSCIKYWFFGLMGMMISNILINTLFKLGQAENEQLVQGMITDFPLVMLLNAGVIAPIVEELVFRKTFRDTIKGKWAFILISSLVFGFMHVLVATSLIEMIFIIPYALLGMAFAYMYYDTDSIYTSILAHILHNTILILISILA